MKKNIMIGMVVCILMFVGGCNKKQEVKKGDMKITSTEIYEMNESLHKEGLKTVLEYEEGDYQVIYTIQIPLDDNKEFDKSLDSVVNVDVKKGTDILASSLPKIGNAEAFLNMDYENIRLVSEFDVNQNGEVVLKVKDDIKLNLEKKSDTYQVSILE